MKKSKDMLSGRKVSIIKAIWRGFLENTMFFKLALPFRSQFLDRPKNLGGTIDLISCVRTYVRPDGFRSNGSVVFSDFWYQGSFLWFKKLTKPDF